MKKFIGIVFCILFLSFLVVGCSSSEDAEDSEQSTENNNSSSDKEEEGNIDYPTKPINMVVPWDAGGGTDIFVRTIATKAEEHLGQPLTVTNKGGAGGTIATTEFLQEEPDGYDLIIEAIGVFSTQPKLNEVEYTADDFDLIIGTSVDPVILTTNKDTGVTNFEEFKEYAENNKVNLGFTGVGSLHQIGWSAFFDELGIQANEATYSGGGELVASLLGNHTQFISLHPVNIKSHEESGNFVPLVTLSPERLEEFPDVPTAKELGYDLEFEVWKFIAAPKGTPEEITDYLHQGFSDILNDPEVSKSLSEGGTTLLKENSPEYVRERLNKDIEATGEILDKLDIE